MIPHLSIFNTDTCKLGDANAEQLIASQLARDLARNCFLLALVELNSHSVAGNPLQALRAEVWPKWHAILHPARPTQLFYHNYVSDREHRKAAADDLLRNFARDCGLVEYVEGDGLRPADWFVVFARESCGQFSEEKNGLPKRYCDLSDTARGVLASGQISSGPVSAADYLDEIGDFQLTSWFTFPMSQSSRLQGETAGDFERRAVRDLKNFLRSTGSHPKTSDRLPHPKRNLDHLLALALYQCCQWPLRKIRETYFPNVTTDQAISVGLRRKAKLIGLKVRDKKQSTKRG
jgi:hypothetical protein